MGALLKLLSIKSLFPDQPTVTAVPANCIQGSVEEEDPLLEQSADEISLFYCESKKYAKFPGLKYQADDMSKILSAIGMKENCEKNRQKLREIYAKWKKGISLVNDLMSLRLSFGTLFNMIGSTQNDYLLRSIMALRLNLWEISNRMEYAIGFEDYSSADCFKQEADHVYGEILELHDQALRHSRFNKEFEDAVTLVKGSIPCQNDVVTLVGGE